MFALRLIMALIFAAAALPHASAQRPLESDAGKARVEGSQQFSTPGIMPMQWSVTRSKQGNTETVTRILQSVADSQRNTLFVVEEKSTKIDNQTTQVVRRTFNLDSEGKRRAIEVVQEDRRVSPDGSESVSRSISKPDLNGGFSVGRKGSETRTSPSPGVWNTTTQVKLPSPNGGFQDAELIQQVEQEKSPGVKEINKITSVLDNNNRWQPSEQRASLIDEKKDGSKDEQESIYRPDMNGQLSLSEQIKNSYRKDAAGHEYWTSESYGGQRPGVYRNEPMALERRVVTVGDVLADGTRRTVQKVEERNPADRASGLRPKEETVTTSKLVGNGVREIEAVTKTVDVNGNLQPYATRKLRVTDK